MLCRYNRDRFFCDIISLFQTFLVNIREPFFYIKRNRFQGKPYVLRVILFHLAVNLTGYHVTRLQLIGETLTVFIERPLRGQIRKSENGGLSFGNTALLDESVRN